MTDIYKELSRVFTKDTERRQLTEKEEKRVASLSKQVRMYTKKGDYKTAGAIAREIEKIEYGSVTPLNLR